MQAPAIDARPIKRVVRYADLENADKDAGAPIFQQAFDVLECEHTVPCRREPGGRLREHDEPCGFCLQDRTPL